MKIFVMGIFAGLLAASLVSVSQAGFMDESDCLHGPSGVEFDVTDFINKVSRRLVACVNHLKTQDSEMEQRLETRIIYLEQRVTLLESR